MAEKDGRENLEDDLDQQRCLFLLELSSALQDRVPSPGIVFARMKQSKEAILVISYNHFFSSQYRRHLRRARGQQDFKIGYIHHLPVYTVKATSFAIPSSMER